MLNFGYKNKYNEVIWDPTGIRQNEWNDSIGIEKNKKIIF